MKIKLRNSQGSALVLVLIVLGTVGYMGKEVMERNDQGSKIIKRMRQDQKIKEVMTEINTLMRNRTTCSATLVGKNPTGATGSAVTTIKTFNDTGVEETLYTAGSLLGRGGFEGSVWLTSSNIKSYDAVTGLAVFELNFGREEGATNLTRTMNIQVSLDAGNLITGDCFADEDGSMKDFCENSIGGRFTDNRCREIDPGVDLETSPKILHTGSSPALIVPEDATNEDIHFNIAGNATINGNLNVDRLDDCRSCSSIKMDDGILTVTGQTNLHSINSKVKDVEISGATTAAEVLGVKHMIVRNANFQANDFCTRTGACIKFEDQTCSAANRNVVGILPSGKIYCVDVLTQPDRTTGEVAQAEAIGNRLGQIGDLLSQVESDAEDVETLQDDVNAYFDQTQTWNSDVQADMTAASSALTSIASMATQVDNHCQALVAGPDKTACEGVLATIQSYQASATVKYSSMQSKEAEFSTLLTQITALKTTYTTNLNTINSNASTMESYRSQALVNANNALIVAAGQLNAIQTSQESLYSNASSLATSSSGLATTAINAKSTMHTKYLSASSKVSQIDSKADQIATILQNVTALRDAASSYV